MAAQSSRSSARSGGGGGTATATAKNGASASSSSARQAGAAASANSNNSNSVDAVSQNPKLLLARGYTSRLLPPVTPPGGGGHGALTLRPLGADEVEKDLRHFQAYHRAVITYRQQYYLAVNPNHHHHHAVNSQQPTSSGAATGSASNLLSASPPSSASAHNAAASSSSSQYLLHGGVGPAAAAAVASLPVRIDPEEEKRLALLRRKIARAEWMREDWEQRYVALRAHYVQASREVRQARTQVAARQEFLRGCVRDRAASLGLLRARLQMTRDVLGALQRRGRAIGQAAAAEAATANADPSPMADPSSGGNSSSGTSKDALLLDGVWNQVEEELKRQQRKMGNPRAGAKGAAVLSWPCTRMPPTPFDVPILLSNASSAPEKTAAFSGNGMFGSDPKASLVWTLPETVPLDEDGIPSDRGAAGGSAAGGAVVSPRRHELDELGEEVAFLQSELDRERAQNQEIAEKIARARAKNDEWVAMICLVRQETEAVLHRHNVVLESDAAREASERWFVSDQDAKRQKKLRDSSSAAAVAATATATATAAAQGGPADGDAASLGVREVEVPLSSVAEGGGGPEDEDNDGDDEGSEDDPEGRAAEEGEEEGEVAVAAANDGVEGEGPSNSKSGSSNKRVAAHQEGEGAEAEDARKKRRKA